MEKNDSIFLSLSVFQCTRICISIYLFCFLPPSLSLSIYIYIYILVHLPGIARVNM